MWHYVYTPCTKKTLGFPAVATPQKWIFFADHNGTKTYFGGEDIFKNSSAELLNFEFPIHVEKKGGWGSLVH